MNILIIGGAGREHAIAWKCAQSSLVDHVFVAPGNFGTETEDGVSNVPIAADDIEGLAKFAIDTGIDMTIVGPEQPLVDGIVDRFREFGLPCFGPTKAAAQLEGSKIFAKEFLDRFNIPTSKWSRFDNIEYAYAFVNALSSHQFPLVVKADALAAGKGVIIAQDRFEALNAIEELMYVQGFEEIVVEEFLEGEEASFMVITDGKNIVPLATSQDHKAALDGDRGPNTGGMGAYSPAPVVTPQLHKRIMEEIIEPTIKGMAKVGIPYEGILYAGLMIDKDGNPSVLEFNCRFGDPECQPILMRMKSDLVALILDFLAYLKRKPNSVQWDQRCALSVVMAAGGYPGSYKKGEEITGDVERELEETKVFHAGTKSGTRRPVTNGGRVLCVTALGSSYKEAQNKAYERVMTIKWQDQYHRTDIGHRAIAWEDANIPEGKKIFTLVARDRIGLSTVKETRNHLIVQPGQILDDDDIQRKLIDLPGMDVKIILNEED